MRLLLIGLLASLGVLLLAAAGVVCHILIQRRRLRSKPPESSHPGPGQAEETDVEPEI